MYRATISPGPQLPPLAIYIHPRQCPTFWRTTTAENKNFETTDSTSRPALRTAGVLQTLIAPFLSVSCHGTCCTHGRLLVRSSMRTPRRMWSTHFPPASRFGLVYLTRSTLAIRDPPRSGANRYSTSTAIRACNTIPIPKPAVPVAERREIG